MSAFMGGAELSGLFYQEAVRPLLERAFPGLSYAAALIGYGSDVLGYDTPISTDHNWGPRLLLFPREEGGAAQRAQIVAVLRDGLPRSFRGYPIGYGPPDAEGVRRPATETAEPVEHMVEVHALRDFLTSWIGVDATAELTLADWLCLPEQKLLEVTAGRVFHDDPGDLTRVRARLAYYPHDPWLYLLAAQWTRIAQQEAFVGRAGDVGDDLGSALVAAALVRDLIKLCFLMERRYAPYSKWFGTAFARLACAPALAPRLRQVLLATSWREREEHLSAAYTDVAGLHNALRITPPLATEVTSYYGRPYKVIFAERFATAIGAAIADPAVRALPFMIGAVDQWSDSTDVLSRPAAYRRLTTLYESN